MVDVLYIKGRPSIYNDQELLYSLRSLEENVQDYDRVFITGECPDFIDKKKVIFLPEHDIGGPMTNHWWKVTRTIEQTDISENFVLMYDDIFFTQPTKLTDYPFYQRGMLGECGEGGWIYRQWLDNTKEWLSKRGYTWYDCELHIPCVYNRKNFLGLYEIFKRLSDVNLYIAQMAVRSTYANLFLKEEPMVRRDVKIRNKDEFVPIWLDCFSVSDEAFKFKTLEYLKNKYNKKGRFEK